MQTSFKHWREYFLQNSNHFAHLNFSLKTELTTFEKSLITSSIQQFQRGESSAGLYLLKVAKETGNSDYYESIRLFLNEEHHHAAGLARYMEQEKIDLIESHWLDSVFRKLRRNFEFENTITVVMTAEIVASVYYRALKRATSSTTLISICEQIISDEAMHINFQAFTIRFFQNESSSLKKRFYSIYRTVLMMGTMLVLWPYHAAGPNAEACRLSDIAKR